MKKQRKKVKGNPKLVSTMLENELERLWPPPPLPLSIRAVWDSAVGSRISACAHPMRLSGTSLLVRVTDSAWMNELQMLTPIILRKLREETGLESIKTLRFELGALPIPSRRLARGRERVGRRPVSELPKSIAEALEKVDDPDLRETIESALAQRFTDEESSH